MKRKDVIKGKKGQHLNQREARLINELVVERMLLFHVDNRKDVITLIYNTEGLISMYEFLRMDEMGKCFFVMLMRNIVIALKELECNKLSKSLVAWEINASYVNPSNGQVYLMYVPLQPYETSGNLKSYLQEIVSACTFVRGEDVGYIQELVRELNGTVAYTSYMLEAYCDRISEQMSKEGLKQSEGNQCPFCMAELTLEEDICPFCGAAVRTTVSSNEGKESSVQRGVMSTSHSVDASRDKLSRDQFSINVDDSGRITVFRSSRTVSQTIWLESHEYTGKILVTKFPFRIGKMQGVTDYRVCNSAVSRKHADVIKEQGEFFVVDLGSTNGTYLNGRKLQPGVKEKLADGALIKFADSEFKIHID